MEWKWGYIWRVKEENKIKPLQKMMIIINRRWFLGVVLSTPYHHTMKLHYTVLHIAHHTLYLFTCMNEWKKWMEVELKWVFISLQNHFSWNNMIVGCRLLHSPSRSYTVQILSTFTLTFPRLRLHQCSYSLSRLHNLGRRQRIQFYLYFSIQRFHYYKLQYLSYAPQHTNQEIQTYL